MLIDKLFAGQRKNYRLTLTAGSRDEHPITQAEWKITEHRGRDGSTSVRPLASVTPAKDGRSAEVHAHAWPGIVELEIEAHAPHPLPADPSAMPRSTSFKKKMVISIIAVPQLAPDLDLRVVPEGIA
jgi:hypothetical protein